MSRTQKRDQRVLDAPFLTFNFSKLISRLKNEETWKHSDRNSITLTMGPGLRAVMVALHDGAIIKPHKTTHPIFVQILEGEVQFITDRVSVVLKKEQMLRLERGISHSVKACSEAVFLLTFGA